LVAVVVIWNLVRLRSTTLGVTYLDDSSMHEQMVRFATAQIAGGHLPLEHWFPFLGLGSPQFLHYQSLPAMVAGVAGLVTGPAVAFQWSLYLLLAFWPVSVFCGARLIGLSRSASALSAVMAPLVLSKTGVGYEQRAYLWTGYGVWTQLWASMTLPLAWGFSWRAIRFGGRRLPAVAFTALTIALHFETGYLVMFPLMFWPFVAGAPLLRHGRRALVLTLGSLLAAAWVVVPLLVYRHWASVNELLRTGPLVNGYGAGRVVGWLVTGQLLDAGRLPILTVFAGLGLAITLARCRRDTSARALLVLLAGCLLLSFGRTTLGPLTHLIPGSEDIFFRRFMMGVQLVGVMMAGTGAITAWHWLVPWLKDSTASLEPMAGGPQPNLRAIQLLAGAAIIGALTPAWLQLHSLDTKNTRAIYAQRRADRRYGSEVNRLIAKTRSSGPGRTYAGMPFTWGAKFTVGHVPVFKYLESRDVDEVGYTLRTASLMTEPEAYFDESNPSDYQLFGIRYLILPSTRIPPVPAHHVMTVGGYALWTVPNAGYVHVGRIVGDIAANRADVGIRSVPLLDSPLTEKHGYLRVSWDAMTHGAPTALPIPSAPSVDAGVVVGERATLSSGTVEATVRMRRPGVAVLSASFDPGWRATVDGRPGPAEMIAPALVGVTVPPGTHTVVFTYHGYAGYPALLVLGLLALVGVTVSDRLLPVRKVAD
jgi:hypothetical protein